MIQNMYVSPRPMTFESFAMGGLKTAKIMFPTTAKVERPATLLNADVA